jgi:hypothetical protein
MGAVTVSDARRAQLKRLSVLRYPPDDIGEWIDALVDLPDDVLAAAVSHALKTRVIFPMPAELRADADAAAFHLTPTPAPVSDRDRERALPAPFVVTVPVEGREPLRLPIAYEWRYDCLTCNDTGWAEFWCAGRGEQAAELIAAREAAACEEPKPFLPRRACQRVRDHLSHAWAMPCPCRDTNPTLRRRAEAAGRKFAAEPAEAGRRSR